MSTEGDPHVFDRSGIAALSDLETAEWRRLFEYLEKEQASFLDKEPQFRTAGYRWPRDPLYEWGRGWEYPYVYYHLERWRRANGALKAPHVIDVGSGVTFFPFALAKLGFNVTCTDVDPVCAKDIERASACVPHQPGQVSYRHIEGSRLPFADAELDAVYCISVLEHIKDFEGTIREIARALKAGGPFILTVDLSLTSKAQMDAENYHKLRRILLQFFEYTYQEVTIHPADALTSIKWRPYPMANRPLLWEAWSFAVQRVIKPLLGRAAWSPSALQVSGFVLKRG